MVLSLQFLFNVLDMHDEACGVSDAEISLQVKIEREIKALAPEFVKAR